MANTLEEGKGFFSRMRRQSATEEQKQELLNQDLDQLWDDKYEAGFRMFAIRNFKDVEILFGTVEDYFMHLWVKVWQRIKQTWPDYVKKSSSPSLDAWASLLLKRDKIDLVRKLSTGPVEFQRSMVSLDKPLKDENDESSTLVDMVPSTVDDYKSTNDSIEINDIVNSLKDPELKEPVRYLLSNPDKEPSEVWEEIRQKFNHHKSYFVDRLKKEPAIADIMARHMKDRTVLSAMSLGVTL